MNLYDRMVEAKPFFLIAGPCVVEDRRVVMETAETLKSLTEKHRIPFIFKSSYAKANRTAITSFSGPGMDEGLRILDDVKKEFQIPILTDVHETGEVQSVADVADILQIPAFLSRQTPLIRAAAETGRIINVKKGQFLAPDDMRQVIEKITASNNFQILLTERGSTFGYHNLVVDFRSFPIMRGFNYPVIFDVTHSLQLPSVGQVSGGTPEYAPYMARAALATGQVDGLFIETHPAPMEALSDSASMIPLDDVSTFLDACLEIPCNRIPITNHPPFNRMG